MNEFMIEIGWWFAFFFLAAAISLGIINSFWIAVASGCCANGLISLYDLVTRYQISRQKKP